MALYVRLSGVHISFERDTGHRAVMPGVSGDCQDVSQIGLQWSANGCAETPFLKNYKFVDLMSERYSSLIQKADAAARGTLAVYIYILLIGRGVF